MGAKKRRTLRTLLIKTVLTERTLVSDWNGPCAVTSVNGTKLTGRDVRLKSAFGS